MSAAVLVTGGAGFIGSHLVDQLIAQGRHVVVLDDLSTGSRDNLATAMETGRLRLVEGSILSQDAVAAAMRDVQLVFHLAVQCVRQSISSPIDSHAVNAGGTITLLEQARQAKVKRFVYCSSSEVYGNASDGLLTEETLVCRPVTVYGAAKLAGELYTDAYRQTYGLGTRILRPFNAYGPRAPERGTRAEVIPRFIIRALNGLPPVIFGDGLNGRDFTYVTEIAHGVMLAGLSPGADPGPINIAYGLPITIRDVAETVLRAVGREDLTSVLMAERPGDVRRLQADTRRSEVLLGYKPDIPFAEGMRRYVDWFRARHPDPRALLEEVIANWSMPPEAYL